MTVSLRSRLETELAYAAQARARGKAGRARVCARRAAGWAVAEYRRRLPDASNRGAAQSEMHVGSDPPQPPPPGLGRTPGSTLQELPGGRGPEGSALLHLRWLRAQPDQPHTLRQAASRLTARVRPDHRLPHEQDPLEDAREIVEAFLTLIERQGSAEATTR